MRQSQTFAKYLTALTPAGAAGIAVLCCVAGVFAAQMAAREWRVADEPVPGADESSLVRVHARAAARRATAKAEAAQFSSTVLLGVAAATALYAIVPGLPMLGICAVAFVGGAYLVGDAVASARAELKRIADEELINDFTVRAPDLDSSALEKQFAEAYPGAARRLKHRNASSIEAGGER
jgi:hypothetical protein